MKLYPCSPEYASGILADIAPSEWGDDCKPDGHPKNGIWYPVDMLMFLSKILTNPGWAGMFASQRLV
jgi:hypothetical protein